MVENSPPPYTIKETIDQFAVKVGGAIYQNQTGRPLFVSVSARDATSGRVFQAWIGASSPPSTLACQTTTASTNAGCITFVVQPGHYYKVMFTAGALIVVAWIEWN